MGLRSLGNRIASFSDVFSKTGFDAAISELRLTVSGGNVNGLSPGNGWTYHTFTSPGTLTISNASTARVMEMLIVGGGGAGGVANNDGSDGGGGGGAGGLIYATSFTSNTLGDGTYTVTTGNGGAGIIGGSSPGSNAVIGQVGGDTTFVKSGPNAELRAKGGGGGGSGPTGGPLGPYGSGGSGGGGGGGGGASPSHTGPAITNTPQPLLPGATIVQRGNIGGFGSGIPLGSGYEGGGGGGAAAGGNPGASDGAGGAGFQYPDFIGPLVGVPALAPLSGYFAGGGSGGTGGPGPRVGHTGGIGGGGSSPPSDGPRTGSNGTVNSGGGGGGASGAPAPPAPSGNGGNGGSGILILRYQ
jgi:hypothetical protein